MAYIILPSRRTRQPQGAVRVDYGSPLSHNISFLFDGVTKRNAVTRTALTPVNAPTTVAKLDGLRQNFVAASSQYIDCGTGADVTFAGGDLTVAVRYSLSTLMADDSAYQLFSRDSNSGGRSFTVDVYRRDANPGFSGARIYANGGGGSQGYNCINEGRMPVSGDDRFAVLVWAPTKNESSVWINGALIASAAASIAFPTATTSARIGARTYAGFENYLNGTIGFVAAWRRGLSASEIVALSANPWQLFAPDTRRLYFGASGGGATIITTSGAASLVARAAVAVAATKAAAVASRATIAGTASTTSIRTSALVAKANSAGTAATTTLRTATIAARTANTGTAATTTLRTGIAAGRIDSNAQTTYAAIIAGAFTAAGRTSARGAAAYTSTHAATAAATTTTRGAASATTLRDGIAAARLDARAAVTAAALVAGTVTTSAAAQIGARASVSNTTERSAALAAMLALRGANPAAPELPVIVPPSTRSLFPDHARLGLSPVAPSKPRLG